MRGDGHSGSIGRDEIAAGPAGAACYHQQHLRGSSVGHRDLGRIEHPARSARTERGRVKITVRLIKRNGKAQFTAGDLRQQRIALGRRTVLDDQVGRQQRGNHAGRGQRAAERLSRKGQVDRSQPGPALFLGHQQH